MDSENYLLQILQKYQARDLSNSSPAISQLFSVLRTWANTGFIDLVISGSRAKGTAISLASDVDYLVSLTNGCDENNGGLEYIYNSLFNTLNTTYQNVRKQNVSIRINLSGLEIDVTPARKQPGNTNDHSLFVSKQGTWKKTNIQKHITDISQSGRINEIKLVKIWRELNKLDFPSIYLEYLLVDVVLSGKSKGDNNIATNFLFALSELGRSTNNPLLTRVVDPANSTNILSDLLTSSEKNLIINKARESSQKSNWGYIVW
ncbi:MAG: nucleotidyltransferase [Candidatus Shapirobacteria bacterium]